jgi:transcriptional regulator with GAF, ATPase, and Fis domain
MKPPDDPEAETFQTDFLKVISGNLTAKSAAILVVDRDGVGFRTAVYWQPEGESRLEFPIDRTMTSRVLASGLPEMSPDNKVVCAALIADDSIFGIIYAESGLAKGFSPIDMWLLAGLTGFIAPPLSRLRHLESLQIVARQLKDEANTQYNMIGASPRMQEVYQFIGKVGPTQSNVGPTQSNVLILGKSGTGKELVARAIHQKSSRANAPFIAVNCGAYTETLIESELFGHEKGAFTGAAVQRKGQFECANRGSIFLDEVAELSMPAQVKLLRVLQEREIQRVGGNHLIKVDVRIIAATNRDLEDMMKKGLFREDLYFRLNVVLITMPSLTERTEDIPLLATYFIQQLSHIRKVSGLSEKAFRALYGHTWEGNVREYRNMIERAVVLGDSDPIRAEDLSPAFSDAKLQKLPDKQPDNLSFDQKVKQYERSLVLDALERAEWNVIRAGDILNKNPRYVYKLARRLEIKL